jgi:hypothetical protein
MNSCNPNNKISTFIKSLGTAVIPGLLMGIFVHQMFLMITGNHFRLPVSGEMIFYSLSFLFGFAAFYYTTAYLYFSIFLGLLVLLLNSQPDYSSFYILTFSMGALSAWVVPKIKDKTFLFLFVISSVVASFLVFLGEIFRFYHVTSLLLFTVFLMFVKLKREKKYFHFILVVFLLLGVALVSFSNEKKEKVTFIFSENTMPISLMAKAEKNIDALVVTNLSFSIAAECLEFYSYVQKIDVVNLNKLSDQLNKKPKDKIFEYNNFATAKLQKEYDLIIFENFIENKVITYSYINNLWNKLSENGAFIIPVTCMKYMPQDAKFSFIPGITRSYFAAGKVKLDSNASILDKRLIKILTLNDQKDYFIPGVFSALFYDEFKDLSTYKLEDIKRAYSVKKLNFNPLYLLLGFIGYLIFRLLYIMKAKDSNFILATENYTTFWLLLFSLWFSAFHNTFGIGVELSIITAIMFLSLCNIQLMNKPYILLQILSLGCVAIFFIDNIYLALGLLLLAAISASAVTSRLFEIENKLTVERFLPIGTAFLLSTVITYLTNNLAGYSLYYIVPIFLLYRIIFIFTKGKAK